MQESEKWKWSLSVMSDTALKFPFTKSYILTFRHILLEQSLGAIWGAVSQLAVLILHQIKLNLQLSICVSFSQQNNGTEREILTDFARFLPVYPIYHIML